MLSITDLLDFIDLDVQTIDIVNKATGLPIEESRTLARQLLGATDGITILHHMFRDKIAEATDRLQQYEEAEMRRAYGYFSRKYPLPHVF